MNHFNTNKKEVVKLQLTFRKTGTTMVVSISGEIDHHNAVVIREEIDRRFSVSSAKNLVFNLKNLRFMDSSGLGILIGRYKAVSATGGKTSIASPAQSTERLINLAGINKIIPVYKTLDEAVGGDK